MSQNNIEEKQQISSQDISTQNITQESSEKIEKNDVKEEENGEIENGIKQQKVEEKTQQIKTEEKVKEVEKQEQNTSGKKKKKNKKDQVLTITAKQLKQLNKMTKKAQQFEKVKEEYEILRKNFQIIRSERDQWKNKVQAINNDLEKEKIEKKNIEEQLVDEKSKNQQLKKKQLHLTKIIEENNKSLENKFVLEQKIRQHEMIIDMTTKNLEQSKKNFEQSKKMILKSQEETQKYKKLLKMQQQSLNNVRNQMDQLKGTVKQAFTLRQQLLRMGEQNQNLKKQKQQVPVMIDKFQYQQRMIKELKQTIKQIENTSKEAKSLNDKFQKKNTTLIEQKKDIEKKYAKAKNELEQVMGQIDALKIELQDQTCQFEVQKKRYTTEIKTLKTQLHNEHEKLKIAEWELVESRKKQKKPIQVERVNVLKMSKQDLLNLLQEMEMKNQSLKVNLEGVADTLHQKDKRIKEQQAAIMSISREITKAFPSYEECQGMSYVQKQIIDIGKQKKQDWALIVQKVMLQNLRLKESVTALGQQYNTQIRTKLEK